MGCSSMVEHRSDKAKMLVRVQSKCVLLMEVCYSGLLGFLHTE